MDKAPIHFQNTKTCHASWYTPLLCICYALFIFRVIAQLIQKFYNIHFLPPFEAWYSGALSYSWLLVSQILIIAIMGWLIAGFVKNSIAPKPRLGAWLIGIGSIYFLVMLFRLIAGFTFAVGHYWLGAHIPAFFHIILASFVLLVGHFHYTHGNKKIAYE